MLALDEVLAGLRVLRRHLRYARSDPGKLFWIGQRIVGIVRTGRLGAVLARHAVVAEGGAEYAAWLREEDAAAERRREMLLRELAASGAGPRFSILLPTYLPNREFLREAVASVLGQSYPLWELCVVDDGSPDQSHLDDVAAMAHGDARLKVRRREANGGIAVATNDALAMAEGDFVVFLDQDDLLAKDALLEFAVVAKERPEPDVMFADEDRIDASSRRHSPFFKPALDREWLRTTNCVLHPFVVRTVRLLETGKIAEGVDGAQDWDLALRLSERVSSDRIRHIPRVLYHWREHPGSTAAAIYEKPGLVQAQLRVLQQFHARRGERVEVRQERGVWRILRSLPSPAPLVSVIVPTRDRADLVRQCVDGLRRRTAYPDWECILVDNGSREPEAVALLDRLARDPGFRVVRDDGDFNYSRLCNAGAEASRGEILVFMNNDVEPLNDEWLSELVVNALRPEIGMVGAMLYYPDGTIQHAGVVLWLNGVADRPYIGFPRGFQGIDHRLGSVHTVTAMITACAAIRRSTYRKLGGMDVAFPIACNDLDLCLRIEEAGFRNILTPYAELYHRESASRGYQYDTPQGRQEAVDEKRFVEQWSSRHARDLTYNPNFMRSGRAFAIGHPVE